MKIFYGLNKFLRSPASSGKFAVTIGVFDGMHLGHRKILNTLVKRAKSKRISTLLITFSPHPALLTRPGKKVPLIMSLKHRLALAEETGVDCALVMHFTRKLSNMSAEEFAKKVLARTGAKEIVVGENFFFGKKKKGSPEDLRRFARECGYLLNAEKTLKLRGLIVSSTNIRRLVSKGRLVEASRLLGRPFAVLGTVIRGTKRGRILGFPTANIDPHHEAIPPSGVYAVKVRYRRKSYKGIVNIGFRPTFKKKLPYYEEPGIEVHIFGFNRNIYGENLEIIFVKKIRNEKKFKNPALLRRQIARDVGKVVKPVS